MSIILCVKWILVSVNGYADEILYGYVSGKGLSFNFSLSFMYIIFRKV